MKEKTQVGDGANYAPSATHDAISKVVAPGEFHFAAAFLDHGHIYGQANGLIEAGATLSGLFEPDEQRREAFRSRYPSAEIEVFSSLEDLLATPRFQLVASAAIPNERADIGLRVLAAGKHYFSDKAPFTTLEQLNLARAACSRHALRWWVYYAERIHNEAAWRAGELIKEGRLGDILHITNLAPHRLAKETRPPWFFEKARYGGIITDIGSHQVEQFLAYSGNSGAKVNYARVANLANPDKSELEDFGEFGLLGDNGAAFYSRLDWFTPAGSPVWGDGRTFIIGTQGSLEIRKYTDPARSTPASLIMLTTGEGVEELNCLGNTGYPFFGQMILDTLQGTERAMTQNHIFLAAELSLRAQEMADNA